MSSPGTGKANKEKCGKEKGEAGSGRERGRGEERERDKQDSIAALVDVTGFSLWG